MPGTTLSMDLPYPTGGDRLNQGDDAIKDLADALDVQVHSPTLFDRDDTTISVTSQTPISGQSGVAACGVSFNAPQSGAVDCRWAVDGEESGSFLLVAGVRLASGGLVGSGTVLDGGEGGDGNNQEIARLIFDDVRKNLHGSCVFRGMTAGAVYNVYIYYRVTGGSGTIRNRSVTLLTLP